MFNMCVFYHKEGIMGLLEALSDKIAGNGDWADSISPNLRARAKAMEAAKIKKKPNMSYTQGGGTKAGRDAQIALNDEYENQ